MLLHFDNHALYSLVEVTKKKKKKEIWGNLTYSNIPFEAHLSYGYINCNVTVPQMIKGAIAQQDQVTYL